MNVLTGPAFDGATGWCRFSRTNGRNNSSNSSSSSSDNSRSCCCSNSSGRRSSSSGDDEDDDDDDGAASTCSSCWGARDDDGHATGSLPCELDLLDARRLPDLLDPERLVAALDACLGTEYVRGSCVVETWDATLSDHLEAIAHLVLYQTPDEHAVSRAVYEQLTELSIAVRPPAGGGGGDRQPVRADAAHVYGTLRTAARSLAACTRGVDPCCVQNMCRAVGLAVAALRANTRAVFTVENFTVEINEAANFANLYCGGAYAKRICAALKDIYDAVMAGDYHPTNVTVQMAVMEKCIRAALDTLADGRATAAQKTAAQRSLIAELDDICATVRMKNHGCADDDYDYCDGQPRDRAVDAIALCAAGRRGPSRRPPVFFTMSPWRAPIRMYHQRSPVSVDQILKSTVHLVELLVSELFKPCLSNSRRRGRSRRRKRIHEKSL